MTSTDAMSQILACVASGERTAVAITAVVVIILSRRLRRIEFEG